MKLFKRPEPYDQSKKQPTVDVFLQQQGQYLASVKVPKGAWRSISAQNLESRTDQQFWNRCSQSREQAGDMSWDSFQSTMLACFGQPNASKLGRKKLYGFKQGSQAINKYTSTWESHLAEIPEAEQPNEHDQLYFYHEGRTDHLKDLTSVDFSTSKPFTSVKALMTAACHIGNSTTAPSVPAGNGNGQTKDRSHKKRAHDHEASGPKPIITKKANSGSIKNGFTPKRTDAEQAYLKAKGLCFHCISKVNLKGELFPHRVHDCPAKGSGVDGREKMPADFRAPDFSKAS